MFLAYQRSGFGFWFACLWFPLLFGIVILSLAAASRAMRWLHVRIHQEPGERPQTIAISMPIPIRFVAWVLRIFKPHIPNLDKANLDEVILALDKTSPTNLSTSKWMKVTRVKRLKFISDKSDYSNKVVIIPS